LQGRVKTMGNTTYSAKMVLCGIGVDFYKTYKADKENIVNIDFDYDEKIEADIKNLIQ